MFNPTPLFGTNNWGTSSPSVTTLNDSSASGTALAFKFTAQSNLNISGIVISWARSGASGTGRATIGVEALTAGLPPTLAAYVGTGKSNVTPTSTSGTSVPEFIALSSAEVGSLVAGTTYALTIRLTAGGGGGANDIVVAALCATATGGVTRGTQAACTKAAAAAFVASASRGNFVLVYEEQYAASLGDSSTIARGCLGIHALNTIVSTPAAVDTTLIGAGGDERGVKWTQAAAGDICGFEFFGTIANLSTSAFTARLYKNDVLVYSQAISPGVARSAGAAGQHVFFLPTAWALEGGATYRFTLRATSTGGITIDTHTLFATAGSITPTMIREMTYGTGVFCYQADDNNAWTDVTNAVPCITPLMGTRNLVESSGGGGGPVTSGV